MVRGGGMECRAGFKNLNTRSLSDSLESIGTTEIGRRCEGVAGTATIGTGCVVAHFHWFGTVEVQTENL